MHRDFPLSLRSLLATALLALAGPVLADDHHVHPTDPTCAGFDNSCWADIQSAVDIATDGDTIHVLGGTYTGISTFTRDDETYHQIVAIVEKDLTLLGSYDPAGAYTTRDHETHPTILDAESSGRAVTILSPSSDPHSVVLDGFEFRNGDYDGLGSSPAAALKECPYPDTDCGGAVWTRYTDLEVRDSRFYVNRAGTARRGFGGALYATGSDLRVLRSEFLFSTASDAFHSDGGAIFLWYAGETEIRGCDFTTNSSTRDGSAIWDFQGSGDLSISDSVFLGHGAHSVVGASWLRPWTFDRVAFVENGATFQSLFQKVGSSPLTLTLDNVLSNQTATSAHIGVDDQFGTAGAVDVTARHLTLIGGDYGFWLRTTGGDSLEAELENVLFKDVDYAMVGDQTGVGSSIVYTHHHSLVDGAIATTLTTNGQPMYHAFDQVTGTAGIDAFGFLLPGSDAIDAGRTTPLAHDIEGQPRPDGAAPDVGADEHLVSAIFWSGFETGDTSEWSS